MENPDHQWLCFEKFASVLFQRACVWPSNNQQLRGSQSVLPAPLVENGEMQRLANRKILLQYK
jgi:hypothetical protein